MPLEKENGWCAPGVATSSGSSPYGSGFHSHSERDVQVAGRKGDAQLRLRSRDTVWHQI